MEHDQDFSTLPQSWTDSLDRALADLSAGRVVQAGEVHAMLRATIDDVATQTTTAAGANKDS